MVTARFTAVSSRLCAKTGLSAGAWDADQGLVSHGETTPSGTTSGSTADGTAGAGQTSTGPEDYPPGPYGDDNPQVGEVVENLQLEVFLRDEPNTQVNDDRITSFSLA